MVRGGMSCDFKLRFPMIGDVGRLSPAHQQSSVLLGDIFFKLLILIGLLAFLPRSVGSSVYHLGTSVVRRFTIVLSQSVTCLLIS